MAVNGNVTRHRAQCPARAAGSRAPGAHPAPGVLSKGHVVVLVAGHGAARGSGLPAGGNLGLLGAGRGLGAGRAAVLGMHPEPTGAEVGEASTGHILRGWGGRRSSPGNPTGEGNASQGRGCRNLSPCLVQRGTGQRRGQGALQRC